MKKLFTLIILIYGGFPAFSQESDRWFIINLSEKPVGFYRESTKTGDANIETVIKLKMKISRLGSETPIESQQIYKENLKGELISIKSDVLLSTQQNVTLAEVTPNSINLTNTIGGKTFSSTMPYQGTLVGYEGIRLLTAEHLKLVGDSITYATFIPDYGGVVRGIRKVIAIENIALEGNLIPCLKVLDSFVGLPTKRTSWLDKKGNLIKSSEPNPFGQMELVLSDSKKAIAVSNLKTELSEDQYRGTVAKSNIRLPQARRMESVTIRITHHSPEIGFPDFTGPYQQVLKKSSNEVILKITSPKFNSYKENISADQKNEYLRSTAFFNLEDTLIQKKLPMIVGNETDPWKKVTMIRDWVNRNMHLNAGITMAPSSEIIRNMEGTCVSYATLTTTLCRAAGIPARYLVGSVYLDGMWGGHAWVEVLINNSWIPIDGSMASPGGIADAARFYFSRSAANNGIGEGFIFAAQVWSLVTVDILEYEVDGKTFKASEKLYTIDDTGYFNPGLGIRMKAINSFEFTDVDKIYPENILFNLQNKTNGNQVELFQELLLPKSTLERVALNYSKINSVNGTPVKVKIKGKQGIQISSPERSILAIENGSDIYVFVVKHINQKSLLESVKKNFEFNLFSVVSY